MAAEAKPARREERQQVHLQWRQLARTRWGHIYGLVGWGSGSRKGEPLGPKSSILSGPTGASKVAVVLTAHRSPGVQGARQPQRSSALGPPLCGPLSLECAPPPTAPGQTPPLSRSCTSPRSWGVLPGLQRLLFLLPHCAHHFLPLPPLCG